MASINEVTLLGRLTKDVEIRKTASGMSVCRVTVACDRFVKDKEKETDFIPVTVWGQSADFLGSYGNKGSLVAVQGSIKTGSYTDKDGKKVYTTDVSANRIQIISEKKGSGNSYSNLGTPLRKEDIDANDGFDVLADVPPEPAVGGDDLPF